MKALQPGQRVRVDQPSHRYHGRVGEVRHRAARNSYWVNIGGASFNELLPRLWLKLVRGSKR